MPTHSSDSKTIEVNTNDFCAAPADFLELARHGKRIRIVHQGNSIACLIAPNDMRFFEELEEHNDINPAEEAMAESGDSVTLDEVLAEFGLSRELVRTKR